MAGKSLASEVKRLRTDAKLSQQALADAVGVSQGAIGHIESGRNKSLDVQTLYALCDALGVECGHFRPYLMPAPVPPPAAPPVRGRAKKA